MKEANNLGGGFGWAAQACDSLIINGFDDWFLPSRDELNFMYGNLHMRDLGNFKNEKYWSSTFDQVKYGGGGGFCIWWTVDFSSGNHSNSYASDRGGVNQYNVRACRQF